MRLRTGSLSVRQEATGSSSGVRSGSGRLAGGGVLMAGEATMSVDEDAPTEGDMLILAGTAMFVDEDAPEGSAKCDVAWPGTVLLPALTSSSSHCYRTSCRH